MAAFILTVSSRYEKFIHVRYGADVRVSMVMTIRNDLLTQGRHIPIFFYTNYFQLHTYGRQKFANVRVLKINYFRLPIVLC